MIEEVKNFTDETGKGVTMYTALNDEEATPRFEGTVGIRTPMGIQPVHFPFPEDYTLEKCFEDFEKVADEEIEKMKKEAEERQKEQNLIITPDQANQQGGVVQFPKG